MEQIFNKLTGFLEPKQAIVSLFLMVIIGVSLYFLFSRNAVARTAWAAIVFI